ncbi:hypothetical protein [Brevundimonas sp.]|uniref:hypothetical protein n=1 Tax=Brevundimonas sp. TaxID=1871086 RepID=UPI001A2A0AF9|nr:hypothetical protein [Brevundimonas sp.]MBJ7485269.1 hypothetical protein [Brevundimonas sp.]
MPISMILVIAAMLCFAGSFWAAHLALSRFRSLERRGGLTQTVPDLIEGNTNTFGLLKLMWATKIPPDRPSLKRLVLAYRVCQFMFVGLMVTALISARSSEQQLSDIRPAMALTVADQNQ